MSTEEATLPAENQSEAKEDTITLTKNELNKIVQDMVKTAKEDMLKELEIKKAKASLQNALQTVRAIDPIQAEPEMSMKDFVESVIEEYEAGIKMNGTHKYCIRENGRDFPYKGDELKFKIVLANLEGQSVDDIVKCYEDKYRQLR